MEGLTTAVKRTDLNDRTRMSNEVVFADYAAHESGDTLPFYEVEGQILALWDQLNELKLEKALLETRTTLSSGALFNNEVYNLR